MNKKFIPLLILLLTITSSCSLFNNSNKTILAENIDTFLLGKDNEYLQANFEEISANYEINASFIIYFAEEGCSTCEQFSPIMDSYLKSSKVMTYLVDVEKDKETLRLLKDEYKDQMFKVDENSNYVVSTPSVCVVSKQEVSYVDYSSYMKTEKAFFNYMNSNYKTGKVHYTSGDVFKKEFIDREFAQVYFDYSNDELMKLYKSKLDEYVYKSSRQVIVSNYKEDNYIHLKLQGRSNSGTYSRLEFFVTEETSDSTIEKVL